MPRSAILSLLMLVIFGVEAQTDPLLLQQQPTVVYEGRSTISAMPYFQRLKRKDATDRSIAVAPMGAGVLPLEERLPLSPSQLVVGRPEMKTVPGLVTPLFVMGMDEVSLDWFSRAATGLADIGARGVVVQANRRDHWHALQLQAQSAGLDLMLLEGDSLAQGYDISTYPTVLMSPELARSGRHE